MPDKDSVKLDFNLAKVEADPALRVYTFALGGERLSTVDFADVDFETAIKISESTDPRFIIKSILDEKSAEKFWKINPPAWKVTYLMQELQKPIRLAVGEPGESVDS